MVSASTPAPLAMPLEEETLSAARGTPTQQTSSSGDESGADNADGDVDVNRGVEVEADSDAELDPDAHVDVEVDDRGDEGDERDQLELDWASAAGSRGGQCPVLTGAAISAAAWNESEDAELYTLIQQFGKHSWGTIYKYRLYVWFSLESIIHCTTYSYILRTVHKSLLCVYQVSYLSWCDIFQMVHGTGNPCWSYAVGDARSLAPPGSKWYNHSNSY